MRKNRKNLLLKRYHVIYVEKVQQYKLINFLKVITVTNPIECSNLVCTAPGYTKEVIPNCFMNLRVNGFVVL